MRFRHFVGLALMLSAVPAQAQTEAEMLFWRSVTDSKSVADYQAYLTQYPRGAFAELARARIATLSRPAPAPAAAPPPAPAPSRAAAMEIPKAPPGCEPVTVPGTHSLPPYPPISQRLGEQGRTVLVATLAASGAVTETQLIQSSGSQRLDAAAMDWVQTRWRWYSLPAGCSTSVAPVSISWELNDTP